ncbi:MAG: hypothetical protein KDE59_14420 [Anaerolineales bacterium]|nr:hypothetical protein [Anaerolineales bacterium]
MDALLDYLWGNVSYLRSFLAAELPEIKLVEPDGTYLVWLDFRGLNLEADELARFLSEDAKLALNAGYWFGREGAGFMRMNIAAPRSMLMAAMKTLKQAVDSRNERP